MYALDMTWWYFFSKFIDYFDSLFFLLRKKFTHLSTLHVVHHGIMPLTAWSGVKYETFFKKIIKLIYFFKFSEQKGERLTVNKTRNYKPESKFVPKKSILKSNSLTGKKHKPNLI